MATMTRRVSLPCPHSRSACRLSARDPAAGAARARPADGEFWHAGCPVPLSSLSLLTVSHWDFAGNVQSGSVGRQPQSGRAARAASSAGFTAYASHPAYDVLRLLRAEGGPAAATGTSAKASNAVALFSPCGSGTGNWSQHAYGLAVTPQSDRESETGAAGAPASAQAFLYLNRSRIRPGMVTAPLARAFRSIGWGWGGSWSGSTKDYMHFSSTGH